MHAWSPISHAWLSTVVARWSAAACPIGDRWPGTASRHFTRPPTRTHSGPIDPCDKLPGEGELSVTFSFMTTAENVLERRKSTIVELTSSGLGTLRRLSDVLGYTAEWRAAFFPDETLVRCREVKPAAPGFLELVDVDFDVDYDYAFSIQPAPEVLERSIANPHRTVVLASSEVLSWVQETKGRGWVL